MYQNQLVLSSEKIYQWRFISHMNEISLYCVCFIAPYLVGLIRMLAEWYKPINNNFLPGLQNMNELNLCS